MRLLDPTGLREWAGRRNLVWSGRCRQSPVPGLERVRFAWPWPRPYGWSRPWQLVEFIQAAVRASSLREPGGWYLWPNDGSWHAGGAQPSYRVRNALLGGLGIPVGFEGAAAFEAAESDALAAAVFACCFMMDDAEGTVADHVYVFPDHGRLGLYFVDEELTWVLATSRESLELFNQELIATGWGWLRDESRNEFIYPGALNEGVT
jgi:hypothetical protein